MTIKRLTAHNWRDEYWLHVPAIKFKGYKSNNYWSIEFYGICEVWGN